MKNILNNFSEEEILAFTKRPKAVKFSRWFRADAQPTSVYVNRVMKYIDHFHPTDKGFYVGFYRGYSYLFDDEGNFTGACGGDSDERTNECIEHWLERAVGKWPDEECKSLDDAEITPANTSWKLTPEKPSDDYIVKCKVSYMKYIIKMWDERGNVFDIEEYIKYGGML